MARQYLRHDQIAADGLLSGRAYPGEEKRLGNECRYTGLR